MAAAAAVAAGRHATNISTPLFPIPAQPSADPLASLSNAEELEIKPGIAEMIREEERVSRFMHLLFSTSFDRFDYEIIQRGD